MRIYYFMNNLASPFKSAFQMEISWQNEGMEYFKVRINAMIRKIHYF